MDEVYHIRYVDKPDEAIWKAVGGGLRSYNTQQVGSNNFQYLCFILYAPDQEIVGGLIGEIHWNWLYVNLLWLKDDLRGCGYGRRLLKSAEDEARRRNVDHVYLDTFSFQAPGFYQQQGYQLFGELPDFPPGHRRYFLTKRL